MQRSPNQAVLANSASPQPSATTSPAPASETAFSPAILEVLRMLDAHVSPEIVVSFVQNSPARYEMTAARILALKERGVPSEVLLAMLKRPVESRGPAARQTGRAGRGQTPGTLQSPPGVLAQSLPLYPSAPVYPYLGYGSWPAMGVYPLYSSWWWTPAWGYPSYGALAYSGYRHRSGSLFPPVARSRWPDAYPNRLVTGPFWGANRGFNGGQSRWADAYPNRLVTGPFWGANRGFARPTATFASRATPGGTVTHPAPALRGRRG